MLQILVAEHHEIVRRGICHLVRSHGGWDVCGEASHGQEALERALLLRPDVMVMDISLPGLSSLEVTSLLRQQAPSISILFYATDMDGDAIKLGLNAGARGYLLRSDSDEHMENTIVALCEPAQSLRPSPAWTEPK